MTTMVHVSTYSPDLKNLQLKKLYPWIQYFDLSPHLHATPFRRGCLALQWRILASSHSQANTASRQLGYFGPHYRRDHTLPRIQDSAIFEHPAAYVHVDILLP
jgi:hypothetical protein